MAIERASKTNVWVWAVISATVVGCAVFAVLQLRPSATAPLNNGVAEPSFLLQQSDEANVQLSVVAPPAAIEFEEIVPPIELEDSLIAAQSVEQPDITKNPFLDRLRALQKLHDYQRLGGHHLIEKSELAEYYKNENSEVYNEMVQWFLADPQAFIELSKDEREDPYLQAVLINQITESNVHMLSEHLHVRNRQILQLAYDRKLHQQDPKPFVDLFDQFAGSHLISLSPAAVKAAAESDYWNKREELLDYAVNKRTPSVFFEAIEQQGQENMFELAEQMWQTHIKDDYVQTVGRSSGKIERIKLAFQYGVSDTLPIMAELLQGKFLVAETIDEFTEVDNASDRFSEIASRLQYNQDIRRWVLP